MNTESRTFRTGASIVVWTIFWIALGRLTTLCWLLINPPVKGWLDIRQAELAPFADSNGIINIPSIGGDNPVAQLIGDSVPRPTLANLPFDPATWVPCYFAAALMTIFFVALTYNEGTPRDKPSSS